ncbi:MAG: ArdC-like ssDNA-binding domain-containing protein [Acidimicrobiia bacterium]
MTTPHGDRSDALRQAHELLAAQVTRLTSSDEWLAMLDLTRRFHTYSARNVLLLAAQGAQGRVAGYRTWQTIPDRDGGHCQVRRGAKALRILAPIQRSVTVDDPDTGERVTRRVVARFKIVHVFDEAALVRPPAEPDIPAPELLRGTAPERLFDGLSDQVHAAGFRVVDGDCEPANGRTDWTNHSVTVRPDLDAAQRAKTLAHELAHVRLHGPTGDGAVLSPSRKEVEAESVAYLVSGRAGLDSASYTIPYVAHWSGGNTDLVLATADRVVATARAITDGLAADLAPEISRDPTRPELGTAALDEATRRHPANPPRAPDHHTLERLGRKVDRDASALLQHLVDNPDAWGASPATRAALARLLANPDRNPNAAPRIEPPCLGR